MMEKNNMVTAEVVVGGQFGSEAKGHVVQRLAERSVKHKPMTHILRVAGPNAGHTGYDKNGTPWALRQVPVAAVVEGNAILGITAGSEIDPPVLLDEIDRLTEAGLMRDKMLWVHGSATVIEERHKAQEARSALVNRVGSTGKGIGAARADRLMRNAARVVDNGMLVRELEARGVAIATPDNNAATSTFGDGHHVIVEGTQGYGLGLHGEFYPQCTSSDCRAIDFLAMAGLNPWCFYALQVWVVARMYPIRVAGNSGPLKDETTWEELGLPEEHTTVTKKVRRVGMPDWDLVREAVVANGGGKHVRLAITMVDQMFKFAKDQTLQEILNNLPQLEYTRLNEYLYYIQQETGAQIGLITTGPNTGSFLFGSEAKA